MFISWKWIEWRKWKEKTEGSSARNISNLTISFNDTIVKVSQKYSDNFAKTVLIRIGCEYDLIPAEARYNLDCFCPFLKPAAGGKSGCPVLLHNLFPQVQKVMTITSGITGDDKTNCNNAREIEISSMTKIIAKRLIISNWELLIDYFHFHYQ